MPLSLRKIHSFIVNEVRSARTIQESLERVIEKCETAEPHGDWNDLRNVEIEDSKKFGKRVKNWFSNKNLKAEISGLWFGIFNPANGRWPIADFRVVGCSDFVADTNDNSWASNTRTWSPDSRAFSPVLERYFKIAYRDNGLGNKAEYPLCLAYTTLALRDVFMTSKPSVFLRNSNSVGVAVGFDGGDFIVLGTLTKNGMSLLEHA
jgi:hypothetical protein